MESITGLGIGHVSSSAYTEAVVSTSFSGKIKSLIDAKSTEIDPFEIRQKQQNMKELQ